MRALRSTFVLALAFAAASCGIEFPAEYRVEDLRVLNVIAEPPEISVIEPGYTATTAEQLVQLMAMHPNTEEVTLTALVAHPDLDATFTYNWKACTPAFSSLPCEGEERRDLVDEETETVSFRPIPVLRDELIGTDDPARALAGVVQDPRDLLNGLYAHLILRAGIKEAVIDVDTAQLDAEKRLVIFDPSLVRVTVSEARRLAQGGMIPNIPGFEIPTLCTRASAGDLMAIDAFLAERLPNRPPAFEAIVARVRTATAAREVTGTIEIDRLDQIELRGRAGLEDREKYRLIDDNCRLVELQETLAFSWFVNVGTLSSPLTVEGNEPREESLRTIYTAPGDIVGSELRVRIWAVLRDGRGGSAHRSIDVIVR